MTLLFTDIEDDVRLIGKSRLALQVAADALDGTGDGVWLAELAPVAEPELVTRTAAAALRVSEAPGRP